MSQDNKKITLLGIIIWSLGAIFFMYEFFLRTFIGSVANQIIPDLNLNPETFSMLGSAYYIAYAAMQIPVGILSDKFGVKLTLSFATLLCALATFYFTHANDFTNAFISRVLMGLGSSFAFVCLLVILINWFPRKYFGSLAGISQFVGTMGPLLGGGPLIALLSDYHESWRTALNFIGIAGIALCGLVIIFVKNNPRGTAKEVIFLQLDSPLGKRLLQLLQNRQAWSIALYSATIYVSIALLGAIWGTAFLQAKGFSQNTAADMVSLSWLGYAIGCPLLGVISDTLKRRKPILIFCACLGVAVTTAMVFLPIGHSTITFSILFCLLGIFAAGQNIGFAIMSEQVDAKTRATALGLNNAAIMLTGAITPPLASYFIEKAGHGSNHLNVHDFTAGFSIMPILCCLALLASIFFIKETYCKPQKDKIILQTNQ